MLRDFFKKMFGNETPTKPATPTTYQDPVIGSINDDEGVDSDEALIVHHQKETTKQQFDAKKYFRRNNKFYRRRFSRGFDYDLEEEIIDLFLLDLLIHAYDDGDIISYENMIANDESLDVVEIEEVESILDIDVDTIPVVESAPDDNFVDSLPEPIQVAQAPEPAYTPPEPAYSAPEPTPSYSSGSSSSSSYDSGSSSSSYDSGSSDSSSSD